MAAAVIKVKDVEGILREVPTTRLLVRTQRRFAAAYVIVSIAVTIGLFALANSYNHTLKNQINAFGVASCMSSRHPGSTINKFDSLVDSIIDIRTISYNKDLLAGDTKQAAIDKKAINDYAKTYIPIPTKEQCEKPLLK